MAKIMTKEKFLDWLVWAFIIITIILFLLRIFGNSPTIDQLAAGALVGFLLKIYSKVGMKKMLVSMNLGITEFMQVLNTIIKEL